MPLTVIVSRLLWAALLGALVGVERSMHKRPAGMRTSACVSLAAALFTIASVEIARRTGDPSTTRIASNIVQGVGFLGAGAIMRESGSVTGLTTAATIFVIAAIGMAAGGGMFVVSGIVCGLVMLALFLLFYLENWLNLRPRYMLFRISSDNTMDLVPDVHQVFENLHVMLDNFQVSMASEKNLIQFDADVSHRQQEKIFSQLARPGVTLEMLPVERQRG